ncbi:hypothetical protein ACWDWO_17745 [Actinopolymorpha singaporensis]|uniref:Uncharacterized protein n=1 Tax=Actinopolymorpha singaporensis TaxID=117157 RepID=A0A1H1T027_9ACTN|nr:hypothetical protein [Actinopolymorpha singaporensis]SDS53570.1 hypothetical protein SAMN04489717_3006 [Actinopolymorpha singaporensis]
MIAVTEQFTAALVRMHARLLTGGRDRGDMVGWILITVMTAALIAVLWAILGPQLQSMLQDALNRARGSVPG